MILLDQKYDAEPIHDCCTSDLPPAYDALSLYREHPVTARGVNQCASTSAFPNPVAGCSHDFDSAILGFAAELNHVDKFLSPPPSLDSTPSSPRNASQAPTQKPRARKNTSWLSFLPFTSSGVSAKRVRQSVLSLVNDLVVPSSRPSREEQKNVHDILASVAETCAEHKVSLSSILQETFIADHTPMYWAIVNYRQELLVALLAHCRPLSIQSVSDIRRACLVGSNQALFHALRVRRPPFHRTDGIQVPSLQTASENLLLGHQPLDDIRIQEASDQAFVILFDIPLWQRRMKAIGQVSIEFIVSGRMWSIIFFSADPSSPLATSGKLRKGSNTWHVIVTLLESSPPTFFDSRLVVDVPQTLAPKSIEMPKLREVRSTTFPSSSDERHQNRLSMYDYNYGGRANLRPSRDHSALAPCQGDRHPPSSSFTPPLSTHPRRGSLGSAWSGTPAPLPISIRLGCGSRKLGRRTGIGEPMETLTTKPETWSDYGVGYTSAAVAPLGDGPACQLLHDHSQYLLPDGTLRGRLEARLVKTESSKDCVIC